LVLNNFYQIKLKRC